MKKKTTEVNLISLHRQFDTEAKCITWKNQGGAILQLVQDVVALMSRDTKPKNFNGIVVAVKRTSMLKSERFFTKPRSA